MTEKIARFGVSLESSLLDRFDRSISRRHYTNRSEALRDLIRRDLVDQEWRAAKGEVIGTITLVYDHHVAGLSQKLTAIQHDSGGKVIASVHVHLDHHNCLEVLIVRGTGRAARDLADRIASVRGVKHATLSTTTEGTKLD